MTDIGDVKVLQAEFRNRAGVLTDPDSINGWVKEPDGSVIPLTFSAASVGIWEAPYEVSQDGKVWWRVEGHGNIEVAGERHFEVKVREVVPI